MSAKIKNLVFLPNKIVSGDGREGEAFLVISACERVFSSSPFMLPVSSWENRHFGEGETMSNVIFGSLHKAK